MKSRALCKRDHHPQKLPDLAMLLGSVGNMKILRTSVAAAMGISGQSVLVEGDPTGQRGLAVLRLVSGPRVMHRH